MRATTKQYYKLLLIDDHQLFADGLEMILQKLGDGYEVVKANNPRTILDDEQKLRDYKLICIDLFMPGINGFAFLKSMAARKIDTPTVVISATEEVSDIEMALKLGAKGFIPKGASAQQMLEGISKILKGNRFVPDYIDMLTLNEASVYSKKTLSGINITSRQSDVLQLIKQGYTNVEIASLIGTAESTVKGHITQLFKLLKVKNRTACIREALAHNLIEKD